MEPEKQKPRARGRGRGAKARPPLSQQQEDPPRPGDRGGPPGQQPGAEAAPRMPQGAQAPPPMQAAGGEAGGRAVRRGTSRQELGPGRDVEGVAREMEGMGIGGGEGGRGRGRREEKYSDRQFRKEGLSSKKGTSGRPLRLRGNFYKLGTPKEWRVYQYHVDFLPVCESTKMKKALLNVHSEVLGPVKAFDGGILFLPHKLPQEEVVLHSNRRADNANIKITIKYTFEAVNINPVSIQVLNIIWRRILGMMDMQQINRHYFNTKNTVQLPQHRLEVMPGFQASILRYEHDVLLDIDITHKIMRTETVLDMMYDLYQKFRGTKEAFQNEAVRLYVGQIVMTRYNNKTYKVDDIAWEKRVKNTFDRNGNQVSFLTYYKSQYNVTITDPDQPLLVTRAKARDVRRGETSGLIYLVPELCVITGLTDENRANYQLMNDLATHTRVNPDGRTNRLHTFMRQIHQDEKVSNELRHWNIQLDENMAPIQGRQLNKEVLEMLDIRKKTVQLEFNQDDADWSRDMRGKIMKLAVPLRSWVIIYPKRCYPKAKDLADTLQRVGPPMGMPISDPKLVEIDRDQSPIYLDALKQHVRDDIRMAVCILPNNKKERYDLIKKFCCIDNPVASQMVLEKTLSNQKRLMSVATKIAIQMNCKLGGVVWTTPIPLKETMIVGFDSYHDSSKKGRSVGGVVATVTTDFARYFSTTTFHTTNVELHNQLQASITACVNAFVRNNGYAPSKIIIYRDGVGDGQLDLVYDHEVSQIRAGVDPNTKLSFVVVKKRTNARFFLEDGGAGSQGRGDPRRQGRDQGATGGRGGYSNPGPGTIIDDVATRPTWFDFFLVAQSVRQGTVTPTHYNVLVDDLGMAPEHYQRLTYKLCHMYYNWQGTIRVPAPCMYAHKLSFLVGQSLHQAPSSRLAEHLYYL